MARKKKESVKQTEETKEKFVLSKQVYSPEVLKAFANYSSKNTSTIIILVCAAIILVCSVAMFVGSNVLYGFLYLLVGLFFAFYPLLIKLVMKRQNKNNVNTTDEYRFFDDRVEIDSFDKDGNKFSSSNVLYSRLFKVRTNKNFGYIYFNKQMAYIVSMENFKSQEQFNLVLSKIEAEINKDKEKNKQ